MTLSLEVAWVNQTQGSVPPLTPTLVVCNCFIALVQLQVPTVSLLSSGTTTLIAFLLQRAYKRGPANNKSARGFL